MKKKNKNFKFLVVQQQLDLEIKNFKDTIQEEVDKSVEFAEQSPFPENDDILLDVYTNGGRT